MKNVIKLMRVKHYIKNLLIFLPIIFSNNITKIDLFMQTIWAFVIFSFATSIIYIINDLKDIEKDKLHPIKKNRPLAAGIISKKQAINILIVLISIIMFGSIILFQNNMNAYMIIITYITINILYSCKLKNVPIIDVTILAIGYLFRIMLGACIINVPISNWLYLTVLSAAFYMGMGKRRNELSQILIGNNTREVLKYYNTNFLDKNMYMCLGLAIVFYSLWCVDISNHVNTCIDIMYTVPIVLIISMKYSLNIEKESTGDPVEVILKDKVILLLIVLLCTMIGIAIWGSSINLIN